MTNRQSQRLAPLLLTLFIALYAAAFIHLTFLRFDAFEARALDLGNFDQAIWNTAHGRWFHLTNQPGIVNRLSLHVEPILIPISALYWIASTPKTLLLLQTVVVALGAIPTYLLAKHELKSPWLALIFGLAFLLNPSMQAANWLEFHAVTLAPSLLLAAFLALRLEKNGLFVLFAILAASCKEEIGLLVFMIGLYATIIMRRYRLGTITMVLSLGWALFAVLGIQHFFGAGNIHWGRYDYLGEQPLQMVLTLVTQPGIVLDQLGQADALGYLTRHLSPLTFFSLIAPELLLLALPSLAINLLADFSPMHQVDTLIYAAPIVPFVFIASIYGLKRILNVIRGKATASPNVNARLGWRHRSIPAILGLLLLASAVANHIAYGYTPGSGNYLHLEVTDHHRAATHVLEQIPPEAKVSAQDRLNPHVSQRETVYIYPRVEDPITGDADTILIDVTGPSFPLHPNDLYQQIQGWRQRGFGIAAAHDGYMLLRKDAPSSEVPADFYSAWQVDSNEPLVDFQPYSIAFGDLVELTGVRVGTDRYGELLTETTWRLLAEHERNLNIYIAYLGEDGQPLHSTEFYPLPASLWYPTSLWETTEAAPLEGNSPSRSSVSTSGSNAETPQNAASSRPPTANQYAGQYILRTLPWTLAEERFALAIGVYYADSGPEWANAERLPIQQQSQAGPGHEVPLLQGGTLARLGGYTYQDDKWSPLPPPEEPVNQTAAQFGQKVALNGFTLHTSRLTAGEELRVDLYWQAIDNVDAGSSIDRDYSFFVHLVTEQGNTVAQLDRQPADRAGFYPMTSWPSGQVVVDEVAIEIPSSTPIGKYRLMTGLYYWEDGKRLLIESDLPTIDSALELGWIEITK